jgi:hypothetical protein
MAPAANEEFRQGEPEQMGTELTAALGDATADALSPADFHERLTQIHTRHLGDNADTAANKTRRADALRRSSVSYAKPQPPPRARTNWRQERCTPRSDAAEPRSLENSHAVLDCSMGGAGLERVPPAPVQPD